MPYVIWSDMYSTTVPYIDTQHKKLIEITNIFYDAIRSHSVEKVIFETLNSLIKYAEEHFKDEEEIMAMTDYPEASSHKEKHEKLVDDIFKLHKELKSVQNPDIHTVGIFLNEWLIQHILLTDKKMAPFCKNLQDYANHKGKSL